MSKIDALPQAEILLICWRHELKLEDNEDAEYVDPMWQGLREEFSAVRPQPYGRNFSELALDLWNYKLVQESRRRYWQLHPRVKDRRFGEYENINLDDRSVCLFRSDLRLNTDGPTVPVLRMVKQIIKETKPKLVLSVGYGGGVDPDDYVGDVLVCSAAQFSLHSDLEGSPVNGQAFRGRWRPSLEWFKGVRFDRIQEPPLQPPSPNYADPEVEFVPETRLAAVRIPRGAVVTSPLVTEPAFSVSVLERDAEKKKRKSRTPTSGSLCATDMDAAAVAYVCRKTRRWGAVVGIVVPALVNFEKDYANTLRDAWRDYLFRVHAREVAAHVARVARRICERVVLK